MMLSPTPSTGPRASPALAQILRRRHWRRSCGFDKCWPPQGEEGLLFSRLQASVVCALPESAVASVAYVTVEDADALDCGVCFLPLKADIFQDLCDKIKMMYQ
ncbi:unnamed protein product [Urochloa humidicola]